MLLLLRTARSLRHFASASASASSWSADAAFQRLSASLGADAVSRGESVRNTHGQDQSCYPTRSPDLVVFPKNVQEVSEVCKICNSDGIPLIPYGAGTGLEGGVSALFGGVSVDLNKMDKIVEYSPSDFLATVEPGVNRKTLDRYVKDDGLWFPVDPGADASVCGMCATSASGTNAMRYGTMKENCLNLEVVLADGAIIETGGLGKRSKKSSAGYNLTEVFVGSEGTLGIITKATVRLHPKAESEAAAVVSFPTIADAVNTVVDLMQCSSPVARVELLDHLAIKVCNDYSKTDYEELPTLFLEFHASASELSAQAELAAQLASARGGSEFRWATLQEDRSALWKARHDMHWATLAEGTRIGCKHISTDNCVPVSKLPEMLKYAIKDLKDNGIYGLVFGHVGDGNFHTHLWFEPDDQEAYNKAKSIADRASLKAIALGGTCTGEHGVGIGKLDLLEHQFGSAGIKTMAAIKHALDPNGIMNPGKVLKA